MKTIAVKTGLPLLGGCGLSLVLLLLLAGTVATSRAATLTVCSAGPPDCGYDSVQAAVNAANPSDLIKVAKGTYTDVHQRLVGGDVITQVLFIDKALTIRGGYSTSDWGTFDPVLNSTALLAVGKGRVVFITDTLGVTIEGLRLGDGRGQVGAGLYAVDATVTLSATVFAQNVAETSGAGLYAKNCDLTLLNSTVYDGHAANGYGGGVYVTGGTATLSDNYIHGNRAYRGAGALYVEYGQTTLTGNRFVANWVEYTFSTGGLGGAVLLFNATAAHSDNLFNDNIAIHGGAIFARESTLTLDEDEVWDNTARNNGGGLMLDDSWAHISNSAITENIVYAPAHDQCFGGGIAAYGSQITLVDSTLSENGMDCRFFDRGGAIYAVSGSSLTLTGNTVVSNVAEYDGGAIFLDKGSADVQGNTFSGNATGGSGGALHATESELRSFSHNVVSGNSAGDDGGGVHVSEGSAAFDHNIFSSNVATDTGGGLHLIRVQDVVPFHSNIMTGNVANRGGGAFFVLTDADLTNSVVVDNRSVLKGSGIYFLGSDSRLRHTTVARNSGGDGSGLHLGVGAHSHITLTNTVLVSHTVGITVAENKTAHFANTLWYDNFTDRAGPGAVTHVHDLSGDPGFVDAYHIGEASAAVDVGADANVHLDVDGDNRPFGPGVDLGADEYSTLRVLKTAHPAVPHPEDTVNYTIAVSNTGASAVQMVITDTLPEHVTPGGQRTWGPVTIPPGGGWITQVAVVVEANYVGELENAVVARTEDGTSSSYLHRLTVEGRGVFLPLILRN